MHSNEDTDVDRLNLALALATRIALKEAVPEPFLDWMREYGLNLFIEAGAMPDVPRGDWPAVGTVLGRAIWNQLPRPDNDFRPLKLPQPGRNDPCPCGSGRKFKHCCGGVGLPPLAFPEELLLPHVLARVDRKDLAAVPHKRFSPEQLADVARIWREEGGLDRARLLLEPIFAEARHLDARHAEAFDALMDIYLDLGKPRKRKALLETCLAASDPVVRGVAHQRQALMLIDAGDSAGAWRAFQAAQRDNPEDPNLATLEISLLQGEDKSDQLKARALFWAAKLRRRRDAAELADMIAFLDSTAADPDSFAERFMRQGAPVVADLADLLKELPPIAHPPHIAVLDDGQGVVEDGLSRAPVEEWSGLYEREEAGALHAWLSAHPEAWDSLTVLEDILAALPDQPEATRWMDRHVLAPLFDRVRALADAALAAVPVPPPRIPWGPVENRTWHRLLYRRARWLAGRGRLDEAIGAGEELLGWNPEDNLGIRDFLGAGYAWAGRYADLLALSERYPDDLAARRYDRVLALFALDRRGDALATLAEAARAYPKVLKMLLAENPKPVRPDARGVLIGGDWEAWLYREAMLRPWQDTGAVDWARQCAPALKQPR